MDVTESRTDENGDEYALYTAVCGDLFKESRDDILADADIVFADRWKYVDELLARNAKSELKKVTYKRTKLEGKP